MELSQLIKEYEGLQKKYKLPAFTELNSNFEIEKIDRESPTLPRLLRKVMMEKVVNLMGLIDLFLTPNNVPRMYFSYLKSMNAEERARISLLYDQLSKLSLDCMFLEIEYNEKKEIEMIIRIMKTWNELKPSLVNLFAQMQKLEVKELKKEKSYFG